RDIPTRKPQGKHVLPPDALSLDFQEAMISKMLHILASKNLVSYKVLRVTHKKKDSLIERLYRESDDIFHNFEEPPPEKRGDIQTPIQAIQ
ncbi:hypothetical protein QYM36_004902, partial [Artemia franciscana]